MIPNKPITRKEMYYSAILGDTTQVPEPITREEQYLCAIAEQGTGGGGGGGGGGESYTLPVASQDTLGGVKGPAKTEAETEPVHIDEQGNLFVKPGDEVTKDSIAEALGFTPVQTAKMDYTLDPDQWSGEAFPYTYTIPLPDTTATQRIYATAAPGLTEAQINAFAEACITGKEQTDGQIVLQAVHKPTVELPIVIEIGGVVADVEG